MAANEGEEELLLGAQARKKEGFTASVSQYVRAMDPTVWHKVAAFSGMAAVGLGTYGSHMYKPKNPVYKEVYNTAALYHLMHTAALVAAPVAKHPHVFGGLLSFGIVAFSGTCYTVAILENRKYAFLAPFGGASFLAAWASLLF
ncbi:transmembrane protein 256 homolog [Selaginella moellendorffii]|nr:transmembrane protein 256 homolog [Selaginella moellendorffii]|eukprot:XP_002964215.2 transmembrane protein 256 homolog [Selaginella moellendorffii]